MVTYYLSFLLFTIHWDVQDNCKVWTRNMIVMFGASYRQATSRIHLVWALKQWNVLVIYVVRMIIVLCFNILLLAMKLFGVANIPNFQNLGTVLWNLWFVPSIVSFAIPHPCLQICNYQMYYVVHKFPNLSRATIHLGIHVHPIAKGKCRESFKEMKNMVINEVYRTPTVTILPIVLLTSKTFFLSLVQWRWGRSYRAFKGWKNKSNFVKVCCFMLL